MEKMLADYFCGNLTDAKKRAKRFSHQAIQEGLIEGLLYSPRKAFLTANFLKGKGHFQAACDAP